VQKDSKLAREVCRDDDAVDDAIRATYRELQERMRERPETIVAATLLLSAARYLERIADLATNIAEDVVFIVDGEVIRHGRGAPPVAGS
jgi:phosphate transport system protein